MQGLLLAALLPGTAAARTPRRQRPLPPQPAATAVGVAATRVHRFVLPCPWRKTGWRIHVWVPETPAPAAGYPVIYALDGNAVFESLEQAGRSQPHSSQVGAIIVGIGYDVSERNELRARARALDYTPPAPGAEAPLGSPRDASVRGYAHPGGGADRFLGWLQAELMPRISSRYPANPARRTIYGHSFGGLFALHALFAHPGAFDTHVAASPSLWWHNAYIFSEAERFVHDQAPLPPGMRRKLLLLTGGQETPGSSLVVDRFAALLEVLRRAPGLLVQEKTFPALGHGAMLPASIGPALRFGSA